MIIAIANRKGGVGKTTTTVNLGHALAIANKRVLIVDLDPQADTSIWFGVQRAGGLEPLERSLASLFADIGENRVDFDTRDAIVATKYHGLDLLPGDCDLDLAETHFTIRTHTGDRFGVLSWILESVVADYDFILLDCPSFVMGMLARNAFQAADAVLIPVKAQGMAVRAVAKFLSILQDIAPTRARVQPKPLDVIGIFVVDHASVERNAHSRDALAYLDNKYQDMLFESRCTNGSPMQTATQRNQTIIEYRESSSQAESFRRLAAEVILRSQRMSKGA